MHGNRAKEKLKSGDIAVALGGHSNTGDTIDFCGPLGFDAFWIEGEHGAPGWHQIGDLSRACDLWNMASIMRLHSAEAGVITRALDLGVSGIVIPHVNSREEAEHVAQSARFAPTGRRGSYGGRRGYGDPDFFARANDEILTIVLIEEVEAVENLDDILSVDHIDVFFVAPGDLAQSMGYVGERDHPEVQAVIDGSLRRITAAGRVAGALGTETTLPRYIELGARFFLMHFDGWIATGAAAYLATIARLKG